MHILLQALVISATVFFPNYLLCPTELTVKLLSPWAASISYMCYSLKTHVMGQVSFTVVWTFCKMWSFCSFCLYFWDSNDSAYLQALFICWLLEGSSFKLVGCHGVEQKRKIFVGLGLHIIRFVGSVSLPFVLLASYFSKDLIVFHFSFK